MPLWHRTAETLRRNRSCVASADAVIFLKQKKNQTGRNHMVHHEWIEQKLIQLETDRCSNQWTEIRERQLHFLRELYASGQFSSWTPERITQQLILIFHGY